jgi:hypothetical protein
MIPFHTTAHFFLYELRPHNNYTYHPFACVAVGYEPSEPKLPFRISATICHPKDQMVRAVGAKKALGLLQCESEGKHAHAAWFKPSEVKSMSKVLKALGFETALKLRRAAEVGGAPDWKRANIALKHVLCDVQGLSFKANKDHASKNFQKLVASLPSHHVESRQADRHGIAT